MSSGMTMPLSSRNLILLMVAKTMISLVRRAVLSPFMTRNRVVDREMYLVRLALDLFWDDNATRAIIPEFDLVDAEHQVKQLFMISGSFDPDIGIPDIEPDIESDIGILNMLISGFPILNRILNLISVICTYRYQDTLY